MTYDPRKGIGAVVILDEGGLWFRRRQDFDSIAAYVGKLDVVVLIPSMVPPHEQFALLVCQPVFSAFRFGIPALLYFWQMKVGGASVQGWFIWMRPQEAYGLYLRRDPSSNAGMVQLLKEWATECQRQFGQEAELGVNFAAGGADDKYSDEMAKRWKTKK